MIDGTSPAEPGLVVLFGSGETSPTGRRIFDAILRELPKSPRLALLETPAGFELNSYQVIRRVGDFFLHRLQNYRPIVDVIRARKRDTELSPDDPTVVEPILHSDLIFMGPGSPSYTVRQLNNSLAWQYIVARHRLGGVLALASAATLAVSAFALPVYEIYKVGEDLHWINGLDFFSSFGLKLVFIPHWNNAEGGAELDTSRCFMGKERFRQLIELLPDNVTMIGLDEKTALVMDLAKGNCQVRGLGKITLLQPGHRDSQKNLPGLQNQFKDGETIPMADLGPFRACSPENGLPGGTWQKAIQARDKLELDRKEIPPPEVCLLIASRQNARQSQDWECADELRKQVEKLGWEILDTKDGPMYRKIPGRVK